jgi:hypothetical protein
MIPIKLRSFIFKLQAATDKREVEWNEADSLAYFCDHKNHTLHISNHFNEDQELSVFYFRIITDSKSTPFSVRENEEDFSIMRDLYEAVIVNANGTETDIEDFFD